MTAALSLADQGFDVDIVELDKNWGDFQEPLLHLKENDVQAFLQTQIFRVMSHPR